MLGADEHRFKCIARKGTVPTRDEIVAIKKAINTLRVEAIRILSGMNKLRSSEISRNELKTFLSRTEINTRAFLRDEYINAKIRKWVTNARPYPDEHDSEIIQALGVFITETNML